MKQTGAQDWDHTPKLHRGPRLLEHTHSRVMPVLLNTSNRTLVAVAEFRLLATLQSGWVCRVTLSSSSHAVVQASSAAPSTHSSVSAPGWGTPE